MQKKQVAIIDVGSSKITAIIGERGINKTFVIKVEQTFDYEGFESGSFFDVDGLKNALVSAADTIKTYLKSKIGTVYVGVPGSFTKVIVNNSQISFPKKRKIQEADVDALFDAAFVMSSTKYTLINRSAIVYELDDARRVANPIGITSEILKGKLSFVLCSNYFIEAVKTTLENAGIENVECVSSALAEALYLIEAEKRDRIAVLVDVGYISTTFNIIQGDGIIYQDSFDFGGGYITAALMQELDLSFDEAEKIKNVANLAQISESSYDVVEGENGKYYSLEIVKKVIKTALDGLCESLANAIENSGYILPEYVSVMITGGGISYIRGAKEHVSGRLDTAVEVVAPSVPLMDKPDKASVLSLLDLALDQIKIDNIRFKERKYVRSINFWTRYVKG